MKETRFFSEESLTGEKPQESPRLEYTPPRANQLIIDGERLESVVTWVGGFSPEELALVSKRR